MNSISFPNIGLYLNNVPDGFQLFGIEIKLYGVVIAFGAILAFLIASKEAKRTGQDPELYLDYLLVMIIPAVACARLYYVIFSWEYYFLPGASFWETFLRIVNLRQGGLAIYGGLIGGILVCLIFSKVRKVSFFQMMDTIAIGVPLAQMIGRFGNFFNREAFGSYTDSLFAMALPLEYFEQNGSLLGYQFTGVITEEMMANVVDGCIWVHPTFLYEGMWNLALFAFLMFWRKKKTFHGELLTIYLGGYGLGRFLVEGLRTDPLMIGDTNLRVSQVLALCLVVMAIAFYVIRFIQAKKQPVVASGESMDSKVEEIVQEDTIEE